MSGRAKLLRLRSEMQANISIAAARVSGRETLLGHDTELSAAGGSLLHMKMQVLFRH